MLAAIGVWIAVGLTLCIYSFLYKDNPFFKFAEHLFVGVSVGLLLANTFHQVFLPYIYNPLKSNFVTKEEVGRLITERLARHSKNNK